MTRRGDVAVRLWKGVRPNVVGMCAKRLDGPAQPGARPAAMVALALSYILVGCGTVSWEPPPPPDPGVRADDRDDATSSGVVATPDSAEAETVAAPEEVVAESAVRPAPLVTWDTTDGGPVSGLSSEVPVLVDVVARDGGGVVTTTDPWGRPALRFPPYSPRSDPPRAIVRFLPHDGGEGDLLSPGDADFMFGADFAVDLESHGSEVDSGNNILQRGLASDVSHYKIEVDARRPACRVQGPEGTVELRTEHRIQAERWYSVRCSRTGTAVQLSVFRVSGDSLFLVEHLRSQGPTGDLRWKTGTPLSVGGKLSANGEVIRSQTDQFNGLIAEPFLKIYD